MEWPELVQRLCRSGWVNELLKIVEMLKVATENSPSLSFVVAIEPIRAGAIGRCVRQHHRSTDCFERARTATAKPAKRPQRTRI